MKVSSVDTNRELIYKFLYMLKDLRNAIAHNSVVFDTRFKKFDPSPAMKKCLENEFALPFVNFEQIKDYVALICYYLELLKEPTEEINTFICDFEKITKLYENTVEIQVAKTVKHPQYEKKLNILKNFFKTA